MRTVCALVVAACLLVVALVADCRGSAKCGHGRVAVKTYLISLLELKGVRYEQQRESEC